MTNKEYRALTDLTKRLRERAESNRKLGASPANDDTNKANFNGIANGLLQAADCIDLFIRNYYGKNK